MILLLLLVLVLLVLRIRCIRLYVIKLLNALCSSQIRKGNKK